MAEEASSIRELDPQTVERIAAGEVVERPASVVKELVENSLDAEATRVEVTVESGGTESIRVADDGVGMTREEVRTAVKEHTTSKIRDVDDLEGGLATLGFRGEALHAIGAVSRMTVRTRPRGGTEGTELTVEGGDVTSVEPAGCPEGTTVEVTDLFYNVPARRKYLKRESTEFAHVNTVVTGYALANPDAAVSLTHDSHETFATTGQGDLRATVMSVYGREVAESMVDVAREFDEDGPLASVSGLVSHPETNRAGREYLSTFVNGRYVTADAVRDAVVDAYGTQLSPDRYPFAVLFVEVAPEAVDVNVHPRKMEVRFVDEESVRQQVTGAVEDALLEAGLVRSSAPRGRSAPDQTEITPGEGNGGDGNAGADRPEATATSGDGTESTASDDANEMADDASGAAGNAAGPTGDAAEEPSETAGGRPSDAATARRTDRSTTAPQGEGATDRAAGGTAANATEDDGTPGEPRTHGSLDAGRNDGPGHREGGRDGAPTVAPVTEQARLGDADPDLSLDSLPSMRVLGQFAETYVVAETDEGLVLVDQHAADERINYERLRERFAGETTTQALAEPVRLELTPREAALFADHGDALARLGFHATLLDDGDNVTASDEVTASDGAPDGPAGDAGGQRVVEVSTVPALVAETAGPELIRDVLSSFVEGEAAAAETVEAAADALLGDLACYPSITGNTSLREGSVMELLSALDDCENPYACPHGRPVVVELDRDEIEERFERDYPGHQGRRE